MEIRAYSTRAWRISTWRTTGVWPETSPRRTAEDPPLDHLLEADLVYIRLHGLGDQPYLYGDPGLPTALSAEQVRDSDFTDRAVFLEGCFGAQMADAFLDAGASVVVGNSGITWGRRFLLGPAQVVGKKWIKQYNAGFSPRSALAAALMEVSEKWGERFAAGWHLTIRSKTT